ncbi:cAMP-regulated phosphoprotein/endosulfine conserved region [Musa troglodytarum]|uniref:cAMP-regulated phosphoprotein/endosulfine conserved region n=1 Tax=Musa troglodytarum TaxID=320322 RepID=A0A9E7G7E1_9LILI|nr:cAMP-regulated phosphoprotein/endosulfine conserved region [Musa troglodytarum]
MAGCNEGNVASQGEEVKVGNKYGSIVPKKQLISKDHERAYFDSADWVLGMAGASSKAKTATESLKPKLKVCRLMNCLSPNQNHKRQQNPTSSDGKPFTAQCYLSSYNFTLMIYAAANTSSSTSTSEAYMHIELGLRST